MVECFCAWFFLIIGLIEKNPQLLIASGVFAIAMHMDDIRKRVDVTDTNVGNKRGDSE